MHPTVQEPIESAWWQNILAKYFVQGWVIEDIFVKCKQKKIVVLMEMVLNWSRSRSHTEKLTISSFPRLHIDRVDLPRVALVTAS